MINLKLHKGKDNPKSLEQKKLHEHFFFFGGVGGRWERINQTTPLLSTQFFRLTGYLQHLTLFRLGFLRVAQLGGGGGRKVPTAYNSKTIYDNEMKFGGVVMDHYLINLL